MDEQYELTEKWWVLSGKQDEMASLTKRVAELEGKWQEFLSRSAGSEKASTCSSADGDEDRDFVGGD